mgnify:CR=1 FL=1
MTTTDQTSAAAEQVIAESNAYEILSQRLAKQAAELEQLTTNLNKARLAQFKNVQMEVIARLRVRTENNCVARDIVQVGEYLLFAYNVFIGLKTETQIGDVFTLYQLQEQQGQFELQSIPLADSFLAHPSFVGDFRELYAYYKHARLVQLRVKDDKLLAAFQIGERITDLRVFRWSIDNKGQLTYIDNRGEREIALPASTDFEWLPVGREQAVQGKHPHLNILDTVFVETLGGDLTIKVENNTNDGLGIYREAVTDKNQSLDDAKVFYASVGKLLLLKILPYREEQWRYLVFNPLNQQVTRLDALGLSCRQLPEDHGLIFPGGIYLQTGELRLFEDNMEGMQFKRMIRSPNGEDVLYIFYAAVAGNYALFTYNLIEKALKAPLFGHGYALAANGQMVLFSAEGSEPTRIHPMQIWQTPFQSVEYASQQATNDSFYARIGNAELVRGVSDLYSITRTIHSSTLSVAHYNQLIQHLKRLPDAYHWLARPETGSIQTVLTEINKTAELVLDEFEKVETIRAQAQQAMQAAEAKQKALLSSLLPDSWDVAENYVDALTQIRQQLGHLMTLREYRYIDHSKLTAWDESLVTAQDQLGVDTLKFLASPKALRPYQTKLQNLETQQQAAQTLNQLQAVLVDQEKMAADLDLLSELMTTLKVDDAQLRIQVTDDISSLYAQLNQLRARTQHRKNNLGQAEAVAQFAVQFKLFSQSVTNALSLATTPEKCDEQLSRLLVQMEELESQFSQQDQFLTDIIAKREEVHENFEAHKQSLVNERQRRAQTIQDAAQRILTSIQRRSSKFKDLDELNTFYASDALSMRLREMLKQLRELDDNVKADDLESNLKNQREQAVRSLRDKIELFEEGGNVIKLGPYRFSVTTQALDITLIPRADQQYIHLTGTDFFERINSPELEQLRPYWQQALESETPLFYRAEYLAGQILEAAEQHQHGLSLELLMQSLHEPVSLLKLVREFAAPLYKEGYEKGIHDHDAAQILKEILPLKQQAGLLQYAPQIRGQAQIFWANQQAFELAQHLPERAKAALEFRKLFKSEQALKQLAAEINNQLEQPLAEPSLYYLLEELAQPQLSFITSHYAQILVDKLLDYLKAHQAHAQFQAAFNSLQGQTAAQEQYLTTWLQALINAQTELSALAHYIPEALALFMTASSVPHHVLELNLESQATDLMGEHPLIKTTQQTRSLVVSLDRFLSRYQQHKQQVVPHYQRYLQLRNQVVEQQREALRLEEFKARPLASFVRNKLLNEAYLPLIGANLAKQMGTVGENKRSDLMGMLMLISPPGYGKTTLMEYVAHRLGLIFMKINCPALGHKVVALDPQQAPDATAAQELTKLNLALEMGNNVMLYLDDIQHTNPEFLQKFISLADGTRRIEGIWQGKTRTYDMRGKRFCVIMAGNPYTESGEVFKIPDMLANRADVYNLGEVLGDKQEIFALSYLENALTANPVLAPLATRDLADVYLLIDLAKGREVSTNQLSYQYSAAELNEIVEVFKRLLQVQAIVLKINQQYIASAAQNDDYRTEPPFKLQGSYRNMNKLAEKISAVMNEAELQQLMADHYQGEAQLLTGSAEENLLKLAELRGNITPEQQQRWEVIKQNYCQNRTPTNSSETIGKAIVQRLTELNQHFRYSDETQHVQLAELQNFLAQQTQSLLKLGSTLPNSHNQETIAKVLAQITEQWQTLKKS